MYPSDIYKAVCTPTQPALLQIPLNLCILHRCYSEGMDRACDAFFIPIYRQIIYLYDDIYVDGNC